MENNEMISNKEIFSEYSKIENIFYSLHCINDNMRLLAEGLAFNEEDESSNALMLCSDSLSAKLSELSECIDRLDMKISDNEKIIDSKSKV